MKTSPINKFVGNCMNYSAKKASGIFERAAKQPLKYAAIFMVSSFVSKDAVNCVFYTYQSATNKKIPEDKRPFVAMLDLSQGIFNVVGQIAAFKIFDRLLIPKLECLFSGNLPDKDPDKPKIYKKSDAAFAADRISEHIQNSLEKNKVELEKLGLDVNELKANPKSIEKAMIKDFGHNSSKAKSVIGGLGIIMTALTANALMKRIMSPLLATPIAGKYKEHLDKKNKQDPELNALMSQQVYQNNNVSDSKKSAFKSFA